MPQAGDFTAVQVYRTHTAGVVPGVSDLKEGEIAINTADGKIYTRNNMSQVVQLGSSPQDVQNAINAMLRPSVTTDDTTARTITAEDENTLILFTSGSAITVTVPDGNALPDGFVCHLHQQGAGSITVSPNGSATVDSSLSLASGVQFGALSLMKVGDDDES